MKYIHVVAALICLNIHYVQAQSVSDIDSLVSWVYFPQRGFDITSYSRNARLHLDSLLLKVREEQRNNTSSIRRISIVSATSPEGDTLLNKSLSNKRAQGLRRYFQDSLLLSDQLFSITSQGIDWKTLTELVESSTMPYRLEVLNILHNTPEWISRKGVVVDGRKRQLMNLRGGRAWDYMFQHFFPKMRYAYVRFEWDAKFRIPKVQVKDSLKTEIPPSIPVKPIETPTLPVNNVVIDSHVDSVRIEPEIKVIEEKYPAVRDSFYMAIKTNLLYDVCLVPNIGVEFYLGKGWTVGGNWMYAWWKSDKKHNYWRVYGGDLNVRKYFGQKANIKPLTGHYFGLYLQGLTYDFEVGGTGYLSDFSYGAGIEYGYSLPIAKRFNLDFNLGLGYLGGKYKVYDPIESCYVWKSTRQRRWFGPTKAEITFVWLLGYGNYNKMGGAKR